MSAEKCRLKHLLEWLKSRTLTPLNVGEDKVQQELSHSLLGEIKIIQSLQKIAWKFLRKPNILLTIWIQQLCSLAFTKVAENLAPHKILQRDAIAALFTIAQTWKQPRCLRMNRQINCGTIENEILFGAQKDMCQQALKRLGVNLNACY